MAIYSDYCPDNKDLKKQVKLENWLISSKKKYILRKKNFENLIIQFYILAAEDTEKEEIKNYFP